MDETVRTGHSSLVWQQHCGFRFPAGHTNTNTFWSAMAGWWCIADNFEYCGHTYEIHEAGPASLCAALVL